MTTWQLIQEKALTPEKLAYYKRFPYSYFILVHPIRILVWLAWEAGLSANAVTAASVLCGVLACVELASGEFLWGASLVILFNVLDGVDGMLARMGRGSGAAGKFLDASSTFPYWFTYFALGLGLARFPDAFALRHAQCLSSVFLVSIGAFATAIRLTTEWISTTYAKNLAAVLPAKGASKSSAERKPLTESLLYKVYQNIVYLEAHDFLLLVAVVTGYASAFLLASAAICLGHFAVHYAWYIRKALLVSRQATGGA